MRSEERGIPAAVSAFVIWGVLTVYWKQLAGLDAFQLIGWRIVFATVFAIVICVPTGRWPDVVATLKDPALRARILLSAILLLGNWTSYVWAVSHDRVLETALGYFLAPLFMMLLGVFVFGEYVTPLKRLAIYATVAGVVMLTVSYGAMPWAGLTIAASWSLYGANKRGVSVGPITSLTTELLVLFPPALALCVYSMVAPGGVGERAQPWQWPLIVGTGAITLLPLVLFAYAARRVPFTLLGPLNFIVPIINFTLGWLVYGEAMPTIRFFGFMFVWLALALVTVDTVRRRNEASRPPSTRPKRGAARS